MQYERFLMEGIANFLKFLIGKKIYIFTVAIVGIILLCLPEFWLEKLYLKDFMLSCGAYVSIATLFFGVLSALIVLGLVFGLARNYIINCSYQKSIENKKIKKLKSLDLKEKEFLLSLIKSSKNEIDISTLNINNNTIFGQLLSKNIIQQEWKIFRVKAEIWNLLQKHKKKIFCEKEFQQDNKNSFFLKSIIARLGNTRNDALL